MFGFFKRRRPAPPRLPTFRTVPIDPQAPRLNGITEAAIWLARHSVPDQAAALAPLEPDLRARVLAEQAVLPPLQMLRQEIIDKALQHMAYALSMAGEKADPDMGVKTDGQGRRIMIGPTFQPRFPLDANDTRNREALNLAFREMLARTWISSSSYEPVRIIEVEDGRLFLVAKFTRIFATTRHAQTCKTLSPAKAASPRSFGRLRRCCNKQ